MIKKIFLKLNEHKSRYWIFEHAQTINFILQGLQEFLEAWGTKDLKYVYQAPGLHYENLSLSKLAGEKLLLLDSDFIKQQAHTQFVKKQDQDVFNLAYKDYYRKRWDDMPKLEISLKNYEMIVQKWHDILKHKPQYLVISKGDMGFVDLVGKDELSEQDLHDMKMEHAKFLKYQAAWEKYDQAHPDRSEIWRSPADSEYEADWQKYLDEPLD